MLSLGRNNGQPGAFLIGKGNYSERHVTHEPPYPWTVPSELDGL